MGQLYKGLLVITVAESLKQRFIERLLRPLFRCEAAQHGSLAPEPLVSGAFQQTSGLLHAHRARVAAAGQPFPEFCGYLGVVRIDRIRIIHPVIGPL